MTISIQQLQMKSTRPQSNATLSNPEPDLHLEIELLVRCFFLFLQSSTFLGTLKVDCLELENN
jgi:hypothetical protein